MRSERGYVGVRMLVVLALVAVLVWVVPFVFLRGKQVVRAHPTAEDPVAQPTGPTAVAPPVEVPAPTGSGEMVGPPIEAADDLQAQATLNDAIRVAQVYYAENGSFQGFGPDAASGYDPSIVYTEGAPAPNMVSMTVTPTSVVLLTVAGETGGYLCVAATGNVLSFGRTDATDPATCQGGWE